jgi:Zn-dependent peptidase ImmA (M78 family)
MNVRRKHIRDLVLQLLDEAGLDHAPINVEEIAQRRNAIIHKQAVDDDFSGYLFRDTARLAAVIGLNSDHHPNRQRFTLAHELGHFLLHTGDEVHIDRQFIMKRRDGKSSEGTNVEEVEANLFAAELLMPEHFLFQDIEQFGGIDLLDEKTVGWLAQKYRVSQQAMTIRLTSLGFL